MHKKRILLCSVFGPFDVNDEYGEAGNKMELFHNQVTREQGLFSYRFNHESFGLHLLAANIKADTTVLDFPQWKDFEKEIKKSYDYVGVSFIIPNLEKAIRMCHAIRQLSPKSKIILGGHGTNIPDIEQLIQHDYICRGEGVYFLRKLLDEDTNAPIRHPLLFSSFNRKVMGVPLPQDSGIIVPGVGCANKCRFCATSHFFREYSAYLKTGQEIFDICQRYEIEKGLHDFFIMDENFLKQKERALELIEIMERQNKTYAFSIFSSAETLNNLGDLDLLVRLGVQFIWLGVESKKYVFEKNEGTDFKNLVKELRRRGIAVLASAILFLEHHDKESIWDDVEFVTSLEPDYLQFMGLGPIPGTQLFADYQKEDILLPLSQVPYKKQHGQDTIWFKHPHFSLLDSRDYLKQAFLKDYQINGASLARAMRTFYNGYMYCSQSTHEHIQKRAKLFYAQLERINLFLPTAKFFSENKKTDLLLRELKKDIKQLTIKRKFSQLAHPLLIFSLAVKEWMRIKLFGDTIQPPMQRKEYQKGIEVIETRKKKQTLKLAMERS